MTDSILLSASALREHREDPMTENLRDRLWQAIADVRDASPRVPNDAATDDIVDAVLDVLGEQS